MANHVTIPELEEPVTYTVGATPQSEFDIPFPFFAASDILVYVDGEAVAAADFTVTGLFVQNGDPVEGAFGSGTMTLDTPVSNVDVTLDRFVGARREDDFSSAAPLSVRSVNTAIDKLTARDQDLRREFTTGVGGAATSATAAAAAAAEAAESETAAEAAKEAAEALVADPPSFLTPSVMAGLKVHALGSSALQTLEEALWALPTVKQWGALGDGSGDTVEEWLTGGDHAASVNDGAGYANLAAIQVDYPHVGALSDTIDWAAIQKALNSGVVHRIPNGDYILSEELVIGDFSGLAGETNSFWQYADNPPSGDETAVLRYAGAGGTDTCVVRASKVAVGVLPVHSLDEAESLRGVRLTGVCIDGGGLAEFGLYSARCTPGSVFDTLVATGTTRRGFWFGELFSCKISHLLATYNYGTGGSFGEDLWGWSTENIVNAVSAEFLIAYKNGLDRGYDDATALREGVGWILAWSRSCSVRNLIGELNFGPGLINYCKSGPTSISNLYLEDNCHFDPDTDVASATDTAYADGAAASPWGMVHYNRESPTEGDTVQCLIDTVFGAAPGGRAQHIWLTGDTSGGLVSEPSEPLVIRSMYGVAGLTADFANYALEYAQSALIDSNPTTTLDRCLPMAGAPESVTGSVTTLYAAATATGNKSGRDTANYITLEDAEACARVNKGVTTLNVSAFTSTGSTGFPKTLDGRGFTRRMTLEGGGTARMNLNATVALDLLNWSSELTLQNFLVLQRTRVKDGRVLIDDSSLVQGTTGHNTEGAALVVDNANVVVSGTSTINVGATSTADKIGVSVEGGGSVRFTDAAAGTIVSYTTADAIHFGEGGGEVYVSAPSWTATWAREGNLTRGTGGSGGVVFCTDGRNPRGSYPSGILLAQSGVKSSHTGSTAETALATITVPGGAMGANGRVRIVGVASAVHTTAGNKTLRVRVGGISGTLYLTSATTTGLSHRFILDIWNVNSASAQKGGSNNGTIGWQSGAAVTSSVDTNSDFDIVISGVLADGTDEIAIEEYAVELFPKT